MLVGFVSDEYYATLADVAVELRDRGDTRIVARSSASGAIVADVPAGHYDVCLHKPGFGAKRVQAALGQGAPVHFRLLSDRLLGYTWPKWCRGGDAVEFRVHAVEPYKLGLWRYGLRKEFIRNIGWRIDERIGRRSHAATPPRSFVLGVVRHLLYQLPQGQPGLSYAVGPRLKPRNSQQPLDQLIQPVSLQFDPVQRTF